MATTYYVNNTTLLGGEVCAEWQPNHAYALGARCVCRTAYATTSRRKHVYECTTAGTSHSTTEPTWPTSGTVNDNDIVWTQRTPTSWDNAHCHLPWLMTISWGAACTVLVHKTHSEEWNNDTQILYGSLTREDPLRILCVDKADDSLATGAIVHNTNTNNNYMNRFQYFAYSYGVTWSSVKGFLVSHSDGAWVFEGDGSSVVLKITGSAGVIQGPSIYSGITQILNASVEFKDSLCKFECYLMDLLWRNGALVVTDGDGVVALFSTSTRTHVTLEGVDLSAIGDGANARALVAVDDTRAVIYLTLSRCKMPSDAGFTITKGTWDKDVYTEIRCHHSSSSNKYYGFYEVVKEGTTEDETTLVRTGGASDGTNVLSIKMVTTAVALELYKWIKSPPITIWNSATTEKTFTIEVLFDSATALQNDEIWMELDYPANNTDGLGTVVSSRMPLQGTPADIPDSSETWTTTGMTNPNTRKLSVTCTPGKAAPVTARVCLAKPSTTVYVDPVITVS